MELTHVILKMLEEYSKNNEFVTITKKRKNQAARKRAKGASLHRLEALQHVALTAKYV